MRVIVTRPAREAQEWVEVLRRAGWQAEPLPLIEIAPAPKPDAVPRVWAQLDADPRHWQAMMFVSANAVEGLCAARRGWALPQTQGPQAWATGPGTARALAAAGWPAECIVAPPDDAPQFDSEALWARVARRVQADWRVLIVRGADAQDLPETSPGASGPDPARLESLSNGAGRDWFAQRLREAGAQVDFVVSYQRRAPAWTPDSAPFALARAAARDGAVWLFSSSEALRNLRSLLPDQDWRAARALVTHERIARAARDAGFGDIAMSRPALTDVREALTAFARREPR
ncbi:uroporphyrinogen-III synthase [Hylemonella gracilis]|uniref:Uroporphyrinogen-III synthase n=1 Tax=Hylemonella gracilis ATCC 19624 TaxID=887062 RepID=F3KX67_9BURK|nr:uroporphyrinogen-III synthase [Hylemonella gracilis]EGI75621.1 uroporphyrinogen III synthase [Hylemonella gracilis ATCC 19624]